jgi:hypothetical protein
MAVAEGASPINLSQSSSGRLKVIIVERFSYYRMPVGIPFNGRAIGKPYANAAQSV